MTEIDRALSEKARRHIGARAQKCYQDAYAALLEMPELADGLYVEGCAICDGDNVIEHGWIELDGRIVDPALCDQGNVSYFERNHFFSDWPQNNANYIENVTEQVGEKSVIKVKKKLDLSFLYR